MVLFSVINELFLFMKENNTHLCLVTGDLHQSHHQMLLDDRKDFHEYQNGVRSAIPIFVHYMLKKAVQPLTLE